MPGGTTETKQVRVELFGVPRLLTGEKAVDVAAALARTFPGLAGPVIDPSTAWLTEGYTFVIDERFTRDPRLIIAPGSPVLLVSSLAGGVDRGNVCSAFMAGSSTSISVAGPAIPNKSRNRQPTAAGRCWSSQLSAVPSLARRNRSAFARKPAHHYF